jgi:hypothetical protein
MNSVEDFVNWLQRLEGETLTEDLICEIIEQNSILMDYVEKDGYETAKDDIIKLITGLE